jgi:hypothetical protein
MRARCQWSQSLMETWAKLASGHVVTRVIEEAVGSTKWRVPSPASIRLGELRVIIRR